MAQGRPLSRHGRYDAFIGMQVKEADSGELYRKSDYMNSSYPSPRPKSGYKTRGQANAFEYDQFARVTTPREEPPARPVSRRGSDRYGGGTQHRMSLEDSDDSHTSTPPLALSESPDNIYSSGRGQSYNSPKPPLSGGRPTSGRPMSAHHRIRSARKQHADMEHANVPYIPDHDMPDLTSARPPSSFSKYRPLPSIGTPKPPDFGEDYNDIKSRTHHPNHLYNVISDPGPHKPKSYQHSHQSQQQQPHRPTPSHSSAKRASLGSAARVSSAVSDISVISTRANSRSNPAQVELNETNELIERLDLSKLDRESEESAAAARRRKSSTSSSASHTKTGTKPSSGSHHQTVDPGDLYDGDDDDSDTASARGFSSAAKQENSTVPSAPTISSPSQSQRAVRKPVVIPSPDHPPTSEILLAVKLPTDGTRHQRYFNSNERLQAIVEFAEEVAGQDFGGYILVSSAPKNVYRDLDDTIESAGLGDKTVLHLEEND
ncbi:hypothetical protein PoB_003478000 [Plakobranchus ocellatus]|uniref:UBX domain-containing protein n=1 Tax=Plakobranchus ocellatus TaxID=259542 RepID=A0AAV4AJC2_9GAST|nr:hypothetical protein PoB_003478000 [Plakobranchus ocellatus]